MNTVCFIRTLSIWINNAVLILFCAVLLLNPMMLSANPQVERIIKVNVAVDDKIRSEDGWEGLVRGSIEKASKVYEQEFNIRWRVGEIIAWVPREKTNYSESILDILRTDVQRGDADVLIGFSSQMCEERKAGIAKPFGDVLVIMPKCIGKLKYNVPIEYIVVHELGHLFGAFHVPRIVPSIMNTHKPILEFDSQTKSVIEMMRSHVFSQGIYDVDKQTKQAWNKIYNEGHDSGEPSQLASAAFDLAIREIENGNEISALSLFKEAIDLDPLYAEPHIWLGVLYNKKQEYDKAKPELLKGLRLDKKNALGFAALGEVYQANGESNKAFKSFRKALQLNPKNSIARYNLGHLYMQSGRLRSAEKEFKTAIEYQPGLIEAYSNLGVVLGMQNKFDESIDILKKAITVDSSHADVFANLGFSMAKVGNWDEAVKNYRKALEINPNLTSAHINLRNALKNEEN